MRAAASLALLVATVGVGCVEPGAVEGFPALEFVTASLPSGVQAAPYSAALEALGGDGTYAFATAATGLPAGLTLTPSGLISGTPTEVGSTPIIVEVRSGDGQAVTRTLALDVYPELVLATATLPSAVALAPYEHRLEATGGDGTYLFSTLGGAASSGITLSVDGLLTGTPLETGRLVIVFEVRSLDGQSASKELPLDVFGALRVLTEQLPSGVVGLPYEERIEILGGDLPYTFAVAPGHTLPEGVSLSPSGLIGGVPSVEGEASFALEVQSGDGQSTMAVVRVSMHMPLLLTDANPRSGVVGSAYSHVLRAAGGAPPYSFELVEGGLPAGLELNPDGRLHGTPEMPGGTGFSVELSSGDGQRVVEELTLAVFEALTILESSVPAGALGSSFEHRFGARGGDGQYTWAVSGGGLPAGLGLSPGGVLSGVPSEGGTWHPEVSVTSSDGQTVAAEVRLFVETAEPVLIAFIADQGWEPEDSFEGPRGVLRLIRDEGTELVVHQGDFDYWDEPDRWERQINDILGPDFPYLASPGNHDLIGWNGPGGYKDRLEARARRTGIGWTGEMGERSSSVFEGVRIILGSPGLFPGFDPASFDPDFFPAELAGSTERWKVCSWHLNQRLMQVGGKNDRTLWLPYEACREGGAIIATGHEHSYSRTHLLSSIENQTVAGVSDTLQLAPGRTFVFVNGLAGASVRPQLLSGDWWASIYTATQGATYGVLFGHFNVGGVPGLAHFYLKDIRGDVIDEFWVRSP